jgi:hypothetical protein
MGKIVGIFGNDGDEMLLIQLMPPECLFETVDEVCERDVINEWLGRVEMPKMSN